LRIRRAVLVITLVGTSGLSLGACSSSGDTFTPPAHGTAPTTTAHSGTPRPSNNAAAVRRARLKAAHLKTLCTGLVAAGNRFTAAEGAFYTSSAAQDLAAVHAIARDLQKVEGLAPSTIRSALHDMIDGFHSFAVVLAHPSTQGSAQLTALGRRLTTDGEKVSGYVTAHCPQS
jgi:hypothetical protein